MIVFVIITSLMFINGDKENTDDFLNITYMLSEHDFEKIKNHVLTKGDRSPVFSNKYNNTPHYSFTGFDVYLIPDVGQRNIDCDPGLSDFNEIVIKDQRSRPQYFYLHIVRKGDLDNKNITQPSTDLIEGKVYLLPSREGEAEDMAEKVKPYIHEMLDKVE